ncbi:MAG: 3'(2'),5'-bisphosphate nucleotidase CysQ [Chroococcidiopsis cubana SAG 39.79]|nr:3'(2'),5'-bisphosphate nucleotidase CysQ [Chroococcidiopsis cubana SAG 39.79]
MSEEGETIFPDAEWCWVIDPLDGTTNFTRGLPIWGISLGLLYRGTPVFGYVHLPPLGQSFHGFWAGDSGLATPTGAFLNHHPIHASTDVVSKNHFSISVPAALLSCNLAFPAKLGCWGCQLQLSPLLRVLYWVG